MANCSTAYERLSHFLHFYSAHHPSERSLTFEGILQRNCIEHGCEHTHIIGRCAIQTLSRKSQSAKNVSTADYYGDFDAKLVNIVDFAGDASDCCRIDPVALVSHQ